MTKLNVLTAPTANASLAAIGTLLIGALILALMLAYGLATTSAA